MEPLIAATEFEICISMSDMVSWLDETSEMPDKNQELEIIFDLLGVKVNSLALYEDYFHNKTGAGRVNVHIYEIKNDPLTVVAIDLLAEPTDQMDLIQLYIRCKKSVAAEISLLVSKFFNNASTQVALSQQSISLHLRNALDKTRFPRNIPNCRLPQFQIHHEVQDEEGKVYLKAGD